MGFICHRGYARLAEAVETVGWGLIAGDWPSGVMEGCATAGLGSALRYSAERVQFTIQEERLKPRRAR